MRCPIVRFCLVALTIALQCTSASTKIVTESDIESWSEVDFYISITDRYNVLLPATVRASDTLQNPVLWGLGPSLNIVLNKDILLTTGYLYANLPHTAGGLMVHVPLAAITLSRKLDRWQFFDRNRGERLIGVPGDPFRYRNRLGVQFMASKTWHAFASDELFYDSGASRWNQNRFIAGVSTALNRAITVDLYCVQRSLYGVLPGQTYGLGVTLGVHVNTLSKKGLQGGVGERKEI
jgi:hypothetical protein